MRRIELGQEHLFSILSFMDAKTVKVTNKVQRTRKRYVRFNYLT